MYKREETILLYEPSLVLLTQFRVAMLRNCHDHISAGKLCPCWSGRWVGSLQWEKSCSPQKGLNTRRGTLSRSRASTLTRSPGALSQALDSVIGTPPLGHPGLTLTCGICAWEFVFPSALCFLDRDSECGLVCSWRGRGPDF